MAIEEVIHRAVVLHQTIEIEYCTRNGKIYSFHISDIAYSRRYGGMYIEAFCLEVEEDRTFKMSRIMSVNSHSFSRIFWNQIGDDFKRIY